MRAHPQNFYRFPVVKPSVPLWVQSEKKNEIRKRETDFWGIIFRIRFMGLGIWFSEKNT